MIYFIYGASGSGKSTLLPLLKDSGLDIEFHDFDDIGVPNDANKVWRQKATNTWVTKALERKKATCILGGAVPGEVVSSPSYIRYTPDVHFLLLDCTDTVRFKRLTERNSYGPNQDIMNWSSWLRVHSINPQWEQHVIFEEAWGDMNFKSLKELSEWSDSVKPEVIDSTNETPIDTAQNIIGWLSSISPTSVQEHMRNFATLPQYIERRMTNDLVAYEKSHGIDVNYKRDNIVIFNNSNTPIAVLSYYTCFSEVYIDDIWVHHAFRGQGYGSKLLSTLEQNYKEKGFNNINCCTSDFQAPEFYKKSGFELEFTRINRINPKLTKYFFVKYFENKRQQQGLIVS